MVKSKAYIDTTILTNCLIKFGDEKKIAKEALAQYEITELPIYAIKEFKAGPLDYVKYLYNKLLETNSIGDTIIALSSVGRQKNRQQTAFKTIGELIKKAESLSVDSTLKGKYGELAESENTIYDSVKLETKMLVFKAWKKRASIATEIVQPLSCYQQIPPFEKKNGELSLVPRNCESDDCCLTKVLRNEKRLDLTKLKVAINSLTPELKNKEENQKRAKLLHEIGSNLRKQISDSDCRNLGDAIFALFCPKDSEILTTNIKDHEPLAKALKKTAITPELVINLKKPN